MNKITAAYSNTLLLLLLLLPSALFAQTTPIGSAIDPTEDNPVSRLLFTFIPEEQAHSWSGSPLYRSLDPSSIKALIWNVKKGSMQSWQKEFSDYGKGKDLLLIQEAYTSSHFENVLAAFSGYRWDLGAAFLYRRYNNTPTGTMIGSTTNPVEVLVRHSPDEEPVTNTPKSITFAKYPIAGSDQELLAVSVHGINLTSYAAFRRHMEQARDEIEQHSGPVLFAGDFNTRTKARTRFLMDLIEKLNLEEVKFEHANHRMAWKFTQNYLDHGFVRGLEVVKAKVLKDSRGSDHRPMIIEAKLATDFDYR